MITDGINSFLFSTPEMTRVFSPTGQLRAMTRFEWALSCALESNGRAETGSGAVLEQLLEADFVDMGALLLQAKEAGNVAIPFVRQLTHAVRRGAKLLRDRFIWGQPVRMSSTRRWCYR